jgi:hypothetical protein
VLNGVFYQTRDTFLDRIPAVIVGRECRQYFANVHGVSHFILPWEHYLLLSNRQVLIFSFVS